jgi:hypothetical protein
MKSDLQSVKDKLVKLINLSENNAASQGEIDNALSMAAQIMARHNLTREDIDFTSSEPAKNVKMSRSHVSCLNANSSTWEGMLARFCVEFVGNINYYQTHGTYGLNKEKRISVYFFYGSEDEVEIACELFKELQEAISYMAIVRFNNFYSKKGGAYSEGFVSGLEQSYHTEKLKLRGDSMTNTLIIKSDNTSIMIKASATNWLASVHKIKLHTGQGTRGASGGTDARQLGKRDGSNYSIGKRSNTRKIN